MVTESFFTFKVFMVEIEKVLTANQHFHSLNLNHTMVVIVLLC